MSARTRTVQFRVVATLATFASVLAMILAISYVQVARLGSLQDDGAKRAEDSLDVLTVGAMGAELYQVVADTIINQDYGQSARDWTAIVADARTDIDKMDAAVDTDAERAHARAIRATLDAMVALYEHELVPALQTGGGVTEQVRQLDGRMDELAATMKTEADAVTASLRKEAEEGDAAFDRLAAQTSTLMTVVAVVALGLIGVLGTWLIRWLSATLRTAATDMRLGAEQVLGASTQVSQASQALSQGSSQQAASLEETSASMEEMAAMTRRNASSANEAATLVAHINERVEGAQGDLQAMVSAMDAISDSSSRIAKIVKTIDEIAFQTNILALNAAVEAARAGEAGMGFAVVADEVRNLAQRAAGASKETASLIEGARSNAELGTGCVAKVRDMIADLGGEVIRVKGIAEEVSTASRQQSQGIDQVSQAITQMEKVTQTTAATAEESASASEELNALAVQSMEVVRRLEDLVGIEQAITVAGGPAQLASGHSRTALRRAA